MKTTPLNKLFDVEYGNKLDLNKMSIILRLNGGVNFIGRSSENNGVTSVVAKIPGIEPYPAGCITVSLGGTKLLSSFVQLQPFYTAQNVAVLSTRADMTFAQKLYICLCIRHNRFRYSAFGREANRTLRTMQVPVPDCFPSWLSDEKITKTKALNDVLLSVEQLSHRVFPNKQDNEVSLVRISDLFDVVYGTNLELNRLTKDPHGITFISRTSENNGISGRVAPIAGVLPIPGGVLTVAAGGTYVLETFYQAEPFYSGRDLYYLRPKDAMTAEEMLFYAHAIRSNRYRFSYGRQANRTLKDLMIPSRSHVPSWVYGSCRAVARKIKEQIG